MKFKKKYLTLGLITLSVVAMGAANVPVYIDQGGTALNIDSGGSLKIAGTAMTNTATELNSLSAAAQTAEGLLPKKVARVVYDVAVDGGSIGTHSLGISLPAYAVVTRNYFQIISQFADSGSGTVAFTCNAANDLYTAADITGLSARDVADGAATGGSTAMVKMATSASCEVKAVVATATQTSGKLVHWIEYVVGEAP